jgi:hypothetical protein
MRCTILSSTVSLRLIITMVCALVAALILATTAFGQETTTPEPTSQPTATPTATQTPEPTSTLTPTSTPETTQSLPTAPPTTTQTPTPETTEQTTPETTTGEPGAIPSITVNPTQGPPGTTVTVTGSGWGDFASRGWPVDIQTTIGARTMAQPNASGTFSVPLTIPESAPPGHVDIMAMLGNGSSVTASFTITQSDLGSAGSKQTSGGPTREPHFGKEQPTQLSPPGNVGSPGGSVPDGPTGGQPTGGQPTRDQPLANPWWRPLPGGSVYLGNGQCYDTQMGIIYSCPERVGQQPQPIPPQWRQPVPDVSSMCPGSIPGLPIGWNEICKVSGSFTGPVFDQPGSPIEPGELIPFNQVRFFGGSVDRTKQVPYFGGSLSRTTQ